MNFSGVTTALVTPFLKGEVDFPSLKRLVKHQLENGIRGFVVSGSTGEAATLTLAEKLKCLDFVKGEVGGQVPIVVGSGTFNTREACELARTFEKAGADGLLIVSPYYSKPPQRGLVAHYSAIARSTKLPIILYNVPSRTAGKLEPETAQTIAHENKNVIGIKEAAGDLAVIKKLRALCPKPFLLVSGDDETFVEAVSLGADGVISVISHVVPRLCVDKNGDKIAELAKLLFCESNPIPVKWALKKMGILTSSEVRLPLVELDAKFHEPLAKAMETAGVI